MAQRVCCYTSTTLYRAVLAQLIALHPAIIHKDYPPHASHGGVVAKQWAEGVVVPQHRLMILGSMDEFVPLVQKAKERGWYTIVCDSYHNSPAKAVADEAYDKDIRDIAAMAQLCRDLSVDGIITSFSDYLAEKCAEIAQAAGLAFYLMPDKLSYVRDKSLMKAMFDELEISYPKTVKVHQASIADDVRGLSFPCVTKPANAWGSHGVFLLNSEAEVETHFSEIAAYASEDYILVEEYDDGKEFNLMSWVCDGKVHILEVADREKSAEIKDTTPHVSRIVYPSRLSTEVLDEAQGILDKVAQYIGLKNGPLCMQFFWKPGRSIRVCECAGRIFGYEHELLEYATEHRLTVEDLLLDSVYEAQNVAKRLEAHTPQLERIAAGLYFHGYEGQIAQIEGLPREDEDKALVEVHSYYQVGEQIAHGVGDKPYVARIYLCADTYDEIDALTDRLFDSLSVKDVKGKELLYHNERVRNY